MCIRDSPLSNLKKLNLKPGNRDQKIGSLCIMKNKSITARSSRPERSTRSINKRRPPSHSYSRNDKMTIPHLKWKTNYSTGVGILPKSPDGKGQNRNKENRMNQPKHYRSNSRARYQKSMQGSGIADLMNFNENQTGATEIKVDKKGIGDLFFWEYRWFLGL